MTTVALENPVAPLAPDQSRSLNIPLPKIPEVKMPDMNAVGKAADNALDRLSQGGYYVMKYIVGMPLGFAAELVGPATMWLPKVALIGAGYGLDKLGSRHPDGRIARLVKGLGEGLWKGGAFGFLANAVVDKLAPGSTQVLADKIHTLDIPSIIAKGQLGQTIVSQAGIAKDAIQARGTDTLKFAASATQDQFNKTFGAAANEIGKTAYVGALGAAKGVTEAVANTFGTPGQEVGLGLMGVGAGGLLAMKEHGKGREAQNAQIPIVTPIVPEVTPVTPEPPQPPVNLIPGGNP